MPTNPSNPRELLAMEVDGRFVSPPSHHQVCHVPAASPEGSFVMGRRLHRQQARLGRGVTLRLKWAGPMDVWSFSGPPYAEETGKV